MKVRDILSGRRVMSLHKDDPLSLAMQVMRRADIHHLPIVSEEGNLLGLLEERDILERHIKVGRAAECELVGSAMSAKVCTVAPDEEVAEAARRLIGHRVSCLMVMDAGRLMGVLTSTDLVQHLAEQRSAPAGVARAVSDLMHKKPLTVAADDPLTDALARMAARNVRHLPVVDAEGAVIGMLSERDVRSAIGDPVAAVQLERTRHRLQRLRVSDVMSHKVLSVREQTPLPEAASRLVNQRVGALSVVDESGRLVGIVSYVDLLGAAQFDKAVSPARQHLDAPAPQPDSQLPGLYSDVDEDDRKRKVFAKVMVR